MPYKEDLQKAIDDFKCALLNTWLCRQMIRLLDWLAGKLKPRSTTRYLSKIRYYWRLVRWLIKHRGETNCRQKWRRMELEIGGDHP